MSVRPSSGAAPFFLRSAQQRLLPHVSKPAAPPVTPSWSYYVNVGGAICTLFAVGVDPARETLCVAGSLYILWSPILHASVLPVLQDPIGHIVLLLGQGSALQMALRMDDALGLDHSEVLSATLALAAAHLALPWLSAGGQFPHMRVMALLAALVVIALGALGMFASGTLAWRVYASAAPPLAFLFTLTSYLQFRPKQAEDQAVPFFRAA